MTMTPFTAAEQAFSDEITAEIANLWDRFEAKAPAAGLDHDTAQRLMAQVMMYGAAHMFAGLCSVDEFTHIAETMYVELEADLAKTPGTALQ